MLLLRVDCARLVPFHDTSLETVGSLYRGGQRPPNRTRRQWEGPNLQSSFCQLYYDGTFELPAP